MHTYFAKMMNLLPIMYVPAVILYLIFLEIMLTQFHFGSVYVIL